MGWIKIIITLIVVVGLLALFVFEIAPEMKRVSENNKKIEQQNAQVIKDRGFGSYDCTYYEGSKVNNCILKNP